MSISRLNCLSAGMGRVYAIPAYMSSKRDIIYFTHHLMSGLRAIIKGSTALFLRSGTYALTETLVLDAEGRWKDVVRAAFRADQNQLIRGTKQIFDGEGRD